LEKNKDKYDQFILLSILWRDNPTEDRVRSFPFWGKYCFIIGGPHGLDEKRLLSHYQISTLGLGQHTMVHGLAKLVLIEQLYRVRMIQNWRNYHY
jgi:23S rRNA pseudoU1915 N3-methylase RlmH